MTGSGVISSGRSDHRSIVFIRKGTRPPTVKRTIRVRTMKNFDNESFVKSVFEAPWNIVEIFDDVNDAWESFKQLFISIADDHAPFKTVTVRGRPSPSVTNDYIAMTWERDHAMRIAEKHGSPLAWDRYRKLRKQVNKTCEKLKTEFFRQKIEENRMDSDKS